MYQQIKIGKTIGNCYKLVKISSAKMWNVAISKFYIEIIVIMIEIDFMIDAILYQVNY